MGRFKDNLLVQFSVASFVILAVLAVLIASIFSAQLNRNIALLQEHGRAMMADEPIQPSDPFSISSLTQNVRSLQRVTFGVLGGTFVILYGSLVLIVWNGWRTITQQQEDLTDANAALQTANAELRETRERYALAVSGANDGIWDWNLTTDTIYFSPRWKAMLGYEEDEIGTRPEEWFSRVHPDDRKHLREELNAHLGGTKDHLEAEYRMRHKDGTYRWMLSRALAVRDENGQATRMAGSQTDVTERKDAEAQLLHDAFHDVLTDLPNRALFMDRLGQAVERAKRREEAAFAVLFLDLDRFKVINDSLGHTIGDQLLVAFAERLERQRRSTDTVARLGGDEFVVLLEGVQGIGDVIRVADRIQEMLRRPFYLQDRELFVTASIGIVLSDLGYDQPESVLRDADIAMYRAKALGRARYKVFEPAMRERAKVLLELETDLRYAVERQELHLQYQPIMFLETNQILGFEALVRWDHPSYGRVSPAEFIPLAEETGLIVSIGRWVLQEACRQVREWQTYFARNPPLFVSVNLSAKQVTQPGLVTDVEHILEDTGLDPYSLKLEITESVFLEDRDVVSVRNRLEDLQTLGVQIQIDDFGTGYSSLGYLQNFSVDALKIDRTFISQLGVNGNTGQLVETILGLAQDLSVDVIAEGVETEEQLTLLRSLNCTYAQGYFLAEPQDSATVRALLAEENLTDRDL